MVSSLRIPEYSPYKSLGTDLPPFRLSQTKLTESAQPSCTTPEQIREDARQKQLELKIETSDLQRQLALARDEIAILKNALKSSQDDAATSRVKRAELEAQVSELKRQLAYKPQGGEPKSNYSAHAKQLDELRESCDRRVKQVEDRNKKLGILRDSLEEEVKQLKSLLLETRMEFTERLKEKEDAALVDAESKYLIKIEGLEKRLASQQTNQKRLEQKLAQAQTAAIETQSSHSAQVLRLEQELRQLMSERERFEASRVRG
mmetsp:Transcript_15515/g.28128  ORF Transcript_15515/g.28128 Transcript_15515/m.28128 type:complete len:261 (+) Transcript_15515:2630-3412(+)